MRERALPSADEMYQAVVDRDTRYDGIFITAVRTTGIFCRPGCTARLPLKKNVEFFATTREALAHGYRPCLRCRPLEPRGRTPRAIAALLADLEADPARRIRDRDLRQRGLDPVSIRRWFRANHQMTFHAYQRSRRIGTAIRSLSAGSAITAAAFDSGYESLSAFQDALQRITGRPASANRQTRVVWMSRVLTPLGPMVVGATESGICLLEFTDRRMLETQLRRIQGKLNCVFSPGANEHSRRLEAELAEYFAGRRKVFEVPLVIDGTPFQEQVWTVLQGIGFGEVRSYAEQAIAIGSPRAVRAVARANGDNRIAIVVPCHRVVGADGSLTGYGGGLWRKRWLLEHEDALAANGLARDLPRARSSLNAVAPGLRLAAGG